MARALQGPDRLTDKQRLFTDYYISSRNASDAARRAGYSVRSARTIGPDLLKKQAVKDAVNAKMREIAESNEITPEFLKEKILEIAKHGKNDSDRLRAYELLGRATGMFEKEESSGTVNLFNLINPNKLDHITSNNKGYVNYPPAPFPTDSLTGLGLFEAVPAEAGEPPSPPPRGPLDINRIPPQKAAQKLEMYKPEKVEPKHGWETVGGGKVGEEPEEEEPKHGEEREG